MTEIDQHKIAQFNDKHDVTEVQQFHALIEEVGELSETYNRDASDEDVGEELSDIVFVARSLAELRDINLTRIVNEVIAENLQSDSSRTVSVEDSRSESSARNERSGNVRETSHVSKKRAGKDGSTEGAKVTKSGLEHPKHSGGSTGSEPPEVFTIEDWPFYEKGTRGTYVDTDTLPDDITDAPSKNAVETMNNVVDVWDSGRVSIFTEGVEVNMEPDVSFSLEDDDVPGDPILAANMALVENDIVTVGTNDEEEHPWDEDPREGPYPLRWEGVE